MLEKKLHAALLTVCPRVHATVAPTATTKPYVTYTQYGGEALNYLDDAQPDLRNAMVQVNVWASTPKSAIALAMQIEQVLRSMQGFIARPQAAFQSDYDPDMEVYGTRQDFTIWDDFATS